MDIRKYTPDDLTTTGELCRRAMELDTIPDTVLQEKITGDPDFDPATTLVAFDENKPVGFIMGVIRQRKDGPIGYVKLLCVAPEHRRKGIASALYKAVEKNFAASGIKKVRVYESFPNYYMPGVDPFYTEAVCFFERNGYYRVGDTSNLEADLVNNDFDSSAEEQKLAGKGITIRRAVNEDYAMALEWTTKNFPAWETEVKNTFGNDPVSLHLAFKENSLEAFSAYEGNNKGLGWFGPMGTTENLRGLGIGGILLRRCLADMKQDGFKTAVIPWVGPIPFYMHYSGSRVKRVFWRYEKKLE